MLELVPSSKIVAALVVTLTPARRRVLPAKACQVPPVRVLPEKLVGTVVAVAVPLFLASRMPELVQVLARVKVPPLADQVPPGALVKVLAPKERPPPEAVVHVPWFTQVPANAPLPVSPMT